MRMRGQYISIKGSGQSDNGRGKIQKRDFRGRFLNRGAASVGLLIAGMLLVGSLFAIHGIEAHALELKDEAERPDAYHLMYVNTDTFLYEEPDENSAALMELKKQSLVVPTEVGDVWVKGSIGEVTGYVKREYLQTESPDPDVAQEIKEQEAYDVEFINEIDRLLREQKRSRIYGIIVILIIAGIFAAGIVSTIMRKKQEEAKDENHIDRSGLSI